MARYRGAVCRLCRSNGNKLFLKGDRCFSDKCALERRKTRPGMHGAAQKKDSEYSIQLKEKQKVKNKYGLLEKQFYRYYVEADKREGITGELMLKFLERRLDNVVYRLGIGKSRNQARQLVTHGHLRVNGKKVDIPSYRLAEGDVIQVQEETRKLEEVKDGIENRKTPDWLSFDAEKFEGKLIGLPKREDIDQDINEQLIVEFYSR